MIKIDRNIKVFYLFYAIMGGVFTSLMPIYYVNLNYSETQIGVLTSIVYVAAILQPLFGYLSDSKFDIVKVLRFNLAIIGLSCVGLYFFTSFWVVFIIILLVSIVRIPSPSLFDNLVMSFCRKHNKNYGTFRIYASFGFGASMVICLPFMYFLGFSSFLIFTFICIVISYYCLNFIPTNREVKGSKNNSYKKALVILLKNKKYLLIMTFNVLFMGCCALKFSYQSLILNDMTGNALYSSVAFLLSTIPEVILMQYFVRLGKRFSYPTYMLFASGIIIVQLVVFINTTNPNVILLFALLHGVSMAIFIPNYLSNLREVVSDDISTSAIVIISTVQSAFTFLFSLFVITPVYANIGIQAVFSLMLFGVILSIIPIVIYNLILRREYARV